jgi:Leucine-rich repeat (LRR) protein
MGGVLVRYALRGDELQSITKIEGKSVKGNYREGQKLRLDWITELRDLSMLSIAGNNLISIDLSALSSCRFLERLDLSENSLRAVDLTPLGEPQLLTHLDLSHNKMRTLTLDPLQSCQRFKWLYL